MSLNYSNILLYSLWIRRMYKYWLVCSEKQIKFHGGIQKERESDMSSGGPAATPLSRRVRQIKRSPPNQRIHCWPGLSNPRFFLWGQRHCLQTPGTAPLCIFYYYVYYFVRGWVEVGDCPTALWLNVTHCESFPLIQKSNIFQGTQHIHVHVYIA